MSMQLRYRFERSVRRSYESSHSRASSYVRKTSDSIPQDPDLTDTKRIKPYGKSYEETNAKRLLKRLANDAIKFTMISISCEDLIPMLRDSPKLNSRNELNGLVESVNELRIAVRRSFIEYSPNISTTMMVESNRYVTGI